MTKCHKKKEEKRPKNPLTERGNMPLIFIVFLITLGLDRAAKILVEQAFPVGNIFEQLGGLFSVVRVYNTGAAFGIMQEKTIFLIVFSTIVLVTLGVYAVKNSSNLSGLKKIAFGLILGGTAGNLFDRIAYGYVIDFIKLGFVDFPVFNIADVCINIGVALLITCIITNVKTTSLHS